MAAVRTLPQSASQTAPSEMGPLAQPRSFPANGQRSRHAKGSLPEGAGTATAVTEDSFFPNGRCAAGHNAAGGGNGQADLITAGLAAKAGHQRGLEHILHDRRGQAGGIAVDRKEEGRIAQHFLALADELIDAVLQLPDLAAGAAAVAGRSMMMPS